MTNETGVSVFFAESNTDQPGVRSWRGSDFYDGYEISSNVVADGISEILKGLGTALSHVEIANSAYALHEVELQISFAYNRRPAVVPSGGHLTVRLRRTDTDG
jgi:hypothetical protein